MQKQTATEHTNIYGYVSDYNNQRKCSADLVHGNMKKTKLNRENKYKQKAIVSNEQWQGPGQVEDESGDSIIVQGVAHLGDRSPLA